MKDFAILLDRLSYTPARLGKLTLLENYFKATPDPERGWALAALTDTLPLSVPLRRILGELAEGRFDPYLFGLARDYVGDSAETLALIWPETQVSAPPSLTEVMTTMTPLKGSAMAKVIASWLDRCDVVERWALLKFLAGAARVGVSARLAKTALAQAFKADVTEIEEVWHGVKPPYAELFAWLSGQGERPVARDYPVFRPMMLSHPLEDADWDGFKLEDFAVEWKWDGIRVQFARAGGVTALYSRTGDDIGGTFPELIEGQSFDAVLDGELLVKHGDHVADFSDLQQRLNRKQVKPAMLTQYPAHIRLYDALILGGEDIRALSFVERRARLEAWHAANQPHHSDLSPVLAVDSKTELRTLWDSIRAEGIEGLMLKRRASPYLQGRPQGHWYKWKRSALTADCVLLYAQRGSGKRSSYYSDYTFGVWQGEGEARVLVPVGKAYSGFTDEELKKLDRFVRDNTTQRFGPVRAVTPQLVFEVAFDAINRSTRHKSGLAMRFPRIARIRWDKPAGEADTLDGLSKLVAGSVLTG
jgi:DNA ligase 1